MMKGVVMAVIYCPDCDSEIPENETICPSCGFDLSTFDVEEEEFNDLLSEANMKLSEEAENAPSAQNGNISISQSQIYALLNGNVVDLTGLDAAIAQAGAKEAAKVAENAHTEPAKETSSEEKEEAGSKAEESAPEKQKKAKKEKPLKQKNTSGNGSISMAVTLAAAAVALALGFCIAMLIFMDAPQTKEEKFALKSANALNSLLEVNERLFVYDAYVRMGAAADECILYAITEFDDVVTPAKYRITVNKTDENTINIYYTLDETSPEYIAMRDSSDPEIRIQASVLKNYSDEIEAAHREISIGTPSWVAVDISEINSNLTSVKSRTVENAAASAK